MSGLIDYYKKFGAEDPSTRYNNPNPLAPQHPFIAALVGRTGQGKTNGLCNILGECSGVFNEILLFSGGPDEFLYDKLEEACNKQAPGSFQRFNSPQELIDEVKRSEAEEKDICAQKGGTPKVQRLCIFDDFIGLGKNIQEQMRQFLIMCRKVNCSVCLLTQNYYEVDKTIRKNLNYIFLMPKIGRRDMIFIHETNQDIPLERIRNMYNIATSGKSMLDWLMVDQKTKIENMRFRWGFKSGFNLEAPMARRRRGPEPDETERIE